MLKSIILLFLLGTIVTLLPFGNSMNNLNTMAIQEENYKSYQTNDILKKIDCDNININLNWLNFKSNQDSNNNNDLITTDNLVSEGIVEGKGSNNKETINANSFGNNFDKDLWVFCNNFNNNKRVGGVAGPQGPQGEQGPSQILPTNIYQVVAEPVFVEDQESATSIAVCDQGDVVLSGSYFLESPFETALFIDGMLSTFDRWHASAQAVADGIIFIQSIAQCFDNPPLRP